LARRLIIVPFDASFHGEAQDSNLDATLESELPGILNRVIEAYLRLIEQNGFTKSQIVKDSVEQYRVMQNSVATWFTENVEMTKKEDHFETSTKLYQVYAEFCKTLSARPVTQTKFGLEIKRLTGLSNFVKKIDGRSVRAYSGIRFYQQNVNF
jgi:putative DNA primase/helicase